MNSKKELTASSGRMNRLVSLFGWRLDREWEVQIQDHQKCWVTWTDCLPHKQSAMDTMHSDTAADKRLNPYIRGVFRVQESYVITRCHYPANVRPLAPADLPPSTTQENV
jgi:hypothetical protein